MRTLKDKLKIASLVVVTCGVVATVLYMRHPKSPMERCMDQAHEDMRKFSAEEVKILTMLSKMTGHKDVEALMKDYCQAEVEEGVYK